MLPALSSGICLALREGERLGSPEHHPDPGDVESSRELLVGGSHSFIRSSSSLEHWTHVPLRSSFQAQLLQIGRVGAWVLRVAL